MHDAWVKNWEKELLRHNDCDAEAKLLCTKTSKTKLVAIATLADDVKKGRSHLWHEKYSLGDMDVLGFVACRVE